jgi:hypothetical protein
MLAEIARAELGTINSRSMRTPEDRAGRLGEGQRPNRAQSKARQGFTA